MTSAVRYLAGLEVCPRPASSNFLNLKFCLDGSCPKPFTAMNLAKRESSPLF